jgi:hypothetical protein
MHTSLAPPPHLPHDDARSAVGSERVDDELERQAECQHMYAQLQYVGYLGSGVVVEPAVAPERHGPAPHACAIKGCKSVAEGLNEVVEVIRLLEEDFCLFAQAAGAGLLVGESNGGEFGDRD